MAADIEKFFAYRTSPGSGDKIGTVRYVDPLTNDTIQGEQAASYGHPAKFIKIADDVGAGTTDLPAKAFVAITTSTVSNIAFDGAFGFSSDATGLLAWIENDSSGTELDHQVRKLTNATSNTYDVNRDWHGSAVPEAADTYRLLVDCFRFNSMLIKTEFSVSGASCVIRPWFFSVNQDNDQPTPNVAAPLRYPTTAFTVLGTSVSTDATDVSATHYHGEILAVGVHGALGACFRVESISSGTVSIWVAMV